MKKVFFLGYALLAIITGASFTSCTNDTDDILAQENEIKLTSAITPASRTNNTDCQSTMIVKGQQVGVTTSGAKEDHKNSPWKAEENGSLTNLGKGLYWNGNQTIDITAYHPYNSQWTETEHTFTVQTDQYNNGNDNNYINSDLLWVAQRQDYTSAPIELKFGHMLSKIIVYIQGNDFGSNVSLCGTVTSANFNLTNGTVTAQNVTPSEIKVSEGATSAAAIIIPQTVANGTQFIKVEYNGKTFYYTLTKNMTFESGKAYTFNLTLKETENEEDGELILVEGNITPWDEMNNYTSGEAFEEATNNTPAEGTIIIKNKALSEALFNILGSEMVTMQDGNAVMKQENADKVQELNLENYSDKNQITTFEGIENFKNLTTLNCGTMANLKTCDISENTELTIFHVENSQIESLNFSYNHKLMAVYCNGSQQLSYLNLTNCTQLSNLQIFDSKLTEESLILPDNVKSAIETLNYSSNTYILSLVGFTNLTYLIYKRTSLTSFNSIIPTEGLSKLEALHCDQNKLTTLDLTKFPKLKELNCYDNKLTSLDISKNNELMVWHCGGQKDNEVQNATLNLTLTASQKALMETGDPNIWWGNDNVSCHIVTP